MARTRGSARRYGPYPDSMSRLISRRNDFSDDQQIHETSLNLQKVLHRNPREFDASIYEHCPSISKLWMVLDQRKRKTNASESVEWEDSSVELLHILPPDLKYEIIEFIPTFSIRGGYKKYLTGKQSEIESSKESYLPFDY